MYARTVAGNDCPDERAFRALVTARVGRDPFTERSEQTVRVMISAEASRIAGRVEILEGTATRQDRTVKGAPRDCEAVVEALASVVALSLAPPTGAEPSAALPALPAAEGRRGEPPPPSMPATNGSTQPASSDVARDGDAGTRSLPVRFAARAALVSSFGVLPGTSIGAEVGAGFARGWFSLHAMARGESQIGSAAGTRGERLDGAVFAGGLLPCFSTAWFAGCAGPWVGALQGRSPDAAPPLLGSSTVGYIGARMAAALPLGSGFRLGPQVELWLPLVRTTLVYAGVPTWTAPAIGGSVGLGLAWVPEP